MDRSEQKSIKMSGKVGLWRSLSGIPKIFRAPIYHLFVTGNMAHNIYRAHIARSSSIFAIALQISCDNY